MKYDIKIDILCDLKHHPPGIILIGYLVYLAGLSNNATAMDFIEIGSIVCFCAVHSHGFKVLFSLSAVLRHTPCAPVGFTILKAGLNKSVLLSVYSSQSSQDGQARRNSHGISSS
jgi:hypothetical protein